MSEKHNDGGAALPQPDLSGTEDLFGLPRGSLVETQAETYRYEPKCEIGIPKPTAAYVAGLEDALHRVANDPYFGELDAESGFAVTAALSARPDAPDVRVVPVAQLERWVTCLRNSGFAIPAAEIRAIIGETEE